MQDKESENPIPATVTIPLLEYESRAFLFNERRIIDRIERRLLANPILGPQLASIGGLSSALTSTPEDLVALDYSQRFVNFQTALDINEFFGNSIGAIPTLEELSEELVYIKQGTETLTKNLEDCCATIQSKLDKLEALINKRFELLEAKIDATVPLIVDETSQEVTNRVVGESYYRYCATTSFSPTLILIFLEQGDKKYLRRSQLKFRIINESEKITDQYIVFLKRYFSTFRDFFIDYGPLRTTYVSKNRKYKNILFTKTKEDAEKILKAVYFVTGHKYDERNRSYTEGRNRAVFNRRKTPLGEADIYLENYDTTIPMYLYKVAVLVNPLKKPLLIFQNKKKRVL
jgi:hypothetical protein